MVAARLRAVMVATTSMSVVASCGSAKPKVVTGEPAEAPLQSPFKRVEHWRYVELEAPLTRVELQLKKYFGQAVGRAQYSAGHTCVAREFANFYEKHGGLPDESLTQTMYGRCGVPGGSGRFSLHEIISDGTLLETGFSSEQLAYLHTALLKDSSPFGAFGITARYRGANALVMLVTSESEASMQLAPATETGQVRLEGVLREAVVPRAVINQGHVGYEECDADENVLPPRYAFTCQMAPGDDEAWVSLQGTLPDGAFAVLGVLPAHRPDWEAPAEYYWAPPRLPDQVDTATAILDRINEWRTELGRTPLQYAAAQSASTEAIYEKVFRINAAGDWNGDASLLAEMTRGRNVGVPILASDLAGGIAFDGDASDWLAVRMLNPRSRETLMSPAVEVAALTIYGHPNVGFGAAVVTYALLTPERLETFAETTAERIATYRGTKKSERLDNPQELEQAAEEVATDGQEPVEAFTAALRRLNVGSRGTEYYDGVLFDLEGLRQPSDLPDVLADPALLSYGVVPTYLTDERDGLARPFCFVWFLTQAPPRKLAAARIDDPAGIALRGDRFGNVPPPTSRPGLARN